MGSTSVAQNYLRNFIAEFAEQHDPRESVLLLRRCIKRLKELHEEELERIAELPLQCAGFEVPPSAIKAFFSNGMPFRKGVVMAMCSLSEANPKLPRVLTTAKGRSELGREFAERARRKRDEAYLERVQWVTAEYEKVRRKYAAGVHGDKPARLEVAQNYQRDIDPGWLMDDKTIRNLLRASRAGAKSDTSEKHGRNGTSGNLRH